MPHRRCRAFVLHIPNDVLRDFAVLEPFLKRLGHDRAHLENVRRVSECSLCILLQNTIHYVDRVSECPLYSITGYHTLHAASR